MIKTAIEVLFDKRFGWRFRLANFIMGDYLRNYLACDNIPLEWAIKYAYKNKPEHVKKEIEKVQNDIQELMRM